MSLIKTIYTRLVIGNIKEMDDEPNVDDWLRFLDTLSQPRDYIDESYNKYRCRAFHFQTYKRFIFNIGALPIALYSYFTLLQKHEKLVETNSERLLIERKADLNYEDIIPRELLSRFGQVSEVLDKRAAKERFDGVLSIEAAQIYRKTIKKHPLSFYYQVWMYRELKKHCGYISEYNPSSVVVYVEERNIASPLLRFLYENTGRKYISFMHGEYLLRLIQAYMAFSEYYIWDNEYNTIFRDVLKCNIGKYILYKPQKLEKKWNFEGVKPYYFCTYYFSAESKESIQKLCRVFEAIEKKGYRCKVRPHPRYSQWEIINKSFSSEQIENPKNVSIEESLRNTRYVIGLATTVLAEGYYEGKEIVVDDITSPKKFENLNKRNFIALKRPHILLSELLQAMEIKV